VNRAFDSKLDTFFLPSCQAKLDFIRMELNKLDVAVSRNINMLRSEIEASHREVSELQRDFDVSPFAVCVAVRLVRPADRIGFDYGNEKGERSD
jgi:hypothetical protein